MKTNETTTKRYIVKCDDCKVTIRQTDDVRESYAGGRCDTCGKRGAA